MSSISHRYGESDKEQNTETFVDVSMAHSNRPRLNPSRQRIGHCHGAMAHAMGMAWPWDGLGIG